VPSLHDNTSPSNNRSRGRDAQREGRRSSLSCGRRDRVRIRGARPAASVPTEELRSTSVRPAASGGPSTSPLDGEHGHF
jgi:hypothetical protein